MKKLGRLTAIFCGVLMALSLALAAACENGGGENGGSATKYTVTLDYDKEKGTVTVSDPADEDGYDDGEEVTVIVMPNPGMLLSSFAVNGESQNLTGGKYVFEITRNTTVSVGFTAVPEGTFSVNIAPYDAACGTVSLSAPASGVSYANAEMVTLTVTPKGNSDIVYVKRDGTSVNLTDGKYTFMAFQNSTIEVVFAYICDVTCDGLGADGFNVNFRGIWKSPAGVSMIIGADKMSFNGKAVTEATETGEGNELGYTFSVAEKNYSITWWRNDYAVGYVINMLDVDSIASEVFVRDPLPEVEITENYHGHWVREHSDSALDIEAGKITYNGEEATCIIDGGYRDMSDNGMWSAPIQSNVYFFYADGAMHLLSWYPDGQNPTVDVVSYVKESDKPYTFADRFRHTWDSTDGSGDKIEISETALKLNGTETKVDGYNEYMFYLTYKGHEWETSIYSGSDYVLQLMRAVTFDEVTGLPMQIEYLYFVAEDLPTVTVAAALNGTWNGFTRQTTDIEDGSTEETKIPNSERITIADGVITYNGTTAKVISGGEREASRGGGYVYTIVVNGKIYNLSYLDVNAEREKGDPLYGVVDWRFTLSGDDGEHEFDKAKV